MDNPSMKTSQRVLLAVSEHPDWSIRRIGRELGVSHSSVVYHLFRLEEAGRLVRNGAFTVLTVLHCPSCPHPVHADPSCSACPFCLQERAGE